MIFGKIDYINLLPFYIFTKKYKTSRFNQILHYKKSYPSKINYLFEKRQINAAFISSIKSKNKDCFDLGIVAKDEPKKRRVKTPAEYKALKNHLSKFFDTKVNMKITEEGEGKIVISFDSFEKLEQIIGILDQL